ncbi:MAG: hypothetical protein V4760_00470 [Bdellovibrionota bacterium]
MKQVFVVFGILLGLQIAAVTASAATVLNCDFDAKFDKKTGAPIPPDLESKMKLCRATTDVVRSVEFDDREENLVHIAIEHLEFMRKGKVYVMDVLFPDLESARTFKARMDSGRVWNIAFRYSEENLDGTFLGRNVIITYQKGSMKPKKTGPIESFKGLFRMHPLFAFPD